MAHLLSKSGYRVEAILDWFQRSKYRCACSEWFLCKTHPIFNVGVNDEVVHLYMQAIEAAEYEKAYFQQMLAGITNHLLGLMYSLDRNNYLDKIKSWWNV